MAELHYISQAQARATEREPLEVHRGYYYSERKEDFFFEYVRQQLIERYGAKTVEQGGLKVYTTIDLNMQRLARKAIAEVLDEPGDPASAIVTIDPRNGDIEAMAESESYEQSQYNLAADGHRQPGSTFKAIDLADALSRGIDPYTTYYFSHTLEPGWLAAEPKYKVQTFEGVSENKSMNLVTATLKSDNTVYAQLAADLGEETITQTAYEMGVKTHLLGNPAQALGGLDVGVTPLEMADVYATLADGGYRNTPIAITKVVFPDGQVDENWGKPHRVKVLSEAVTAEETSILARERRGAAPRRARRSTARPPPRPARPKNSSTPGSTATPPTTRRSSGWATRKRDVPMTDVHGEPQQGGYLPAEIWHAYMAAVTEGQPCVAVPAIQGSDLLQAVLRQVREHRARAGGPGSRTHARTRRQEATTSTPRPTRTRRRPARPAPPNRARRPRPPGQPSTPPAQHAAEEPVDKQTGGAGPG